jgi:hypothetical protein
LASYVSAGSCTIGDKTFSGFVYTPNAGGGAVAIGATSITVDTIGPASTGATITGPDIGLQFSAAWSVGAGQNLDSLIQFTLSVTGGAAIIKDAGLVQLGTGASGTGIAQVAENLGNGSNLLTFVNAPAGTSKTVDTVNFSPTGSFSVVKDISVNGGTNGTAAISLVNDTFSQIVPLPATFALFGTGLVGLGLLRRRRKTP